MATSKIVPYIGLDEVTGDKFGLFKALVAEAVGTLLLVLVGCGSCMGGEEPDIVRIALCFGITVASLAQCIGHVSGCHINPAVTAGLFVGRKIGLYKALLYLVVQCVGAVCGSGILLAIISPVGDIRGSSRMGMTSVEPKINGGQAFAVEFLITFVLVLVIFASAADDNNVPNVKGSIPLAIGLSITTCHLFAIPLTGSSMNPARTFGPAVILGDWSNHWIYWAGPILGGVFASILYQMVFSSPKPTLQPVDPYSAVATTDKDP